ncbi:MAG: hypothetical protein JWQ89_723 [Devosia sp.]|uniref:hypothetical protein n=1 Tax=Devosia sp. TaxID=1871048 RepID=UPI0026358820|nr:hypothetical protein [Devosia sp.]MDB5538996.1 hypothetical protein [Devosia sp.]
MKRRELMTIVSLAAGLSLGLSAAPALAGKISAVQHAEPQGFIKSGNPHAAGGLDNPGKGNPFNIY